MSGDNIFTRHVLQVHSGCLALDVASRPAPSQFCPSIASVEPPQESAPFKQAPIVATKPAHPSLPELMHVRHVNNLLVILDNWHLFLQHGRHVENPVNAFEVVAQRIFSMCGAHFCTVADTSTILSLKRTNGFCTVWDIEICLCTATVPHTDLPKCCCAKVSRQLCRPDCRKKSVDWVSNFHKR